MGSLSATLCDQRSAPGNAAHVVYVRLGGHAYSFLLHTTQASDGTDKPLYLSLMQRFLYLGTPGA